MASGTRSLFRRLLGWLVAAVVVGILLVVGGTFARAWLLAPAEPLQAWHTEVPDDMTADVIDNADWQTYLVAEDKVFTQVRQTITRDLEPGARLPYNRYFSGSPVNPAGFNRDWNRSFVLEPAGPPVGAVVLLHGLTDAPYSLRHVAERYQRRGYVAIGIRMPAHGTVPAALTKAKWQDWAAATRLAMREARRRAGPGKPIEMVGYSNGGALAVNYELEALANPALPGAGRIVLLSPMIGLTEFAAFAGVAGWPALFPAFAHAAWLDIIPEYNPFKYNSFPVNAARQSYLLTAALEAGMKTAAASGRLQKMPPILTFQSVADSTVSTPAVVTRLYDQLPANGSELVIFDINRAAQFGPMLRPALANRLATMLPPRARRYRVTVITNASPETDAVVERSTAPGLTTPVDRDIGLAFPRQVYSLTHIALPFPANDGLYGAEPDPADDFGIQIGAMAARGERGVLIITLDTLLRLTSNPFFPYLADRIDGATTAPDASTDTPPP